MRFLFRLLEVAVLIGAFSLFSSTSGAEKNVILIVTDDESPTLGCYGDPIAQTPQIDALAADGTVFLNAFTTTSSCSASRSVIMSGLQNHANGQYGHPHSYHGFHSWNTVVSFSLPRVMALSGYRTGHVGKYHVAPEEVFHFETYLKGNLRNALDMANASKEFLTADDSRPFFLYFAPGGPHRGGPLDENSKLELKPNLFGNRPNHEAYPGIKEVFYDPEKIPVPPFLPDNSETREELAQYYQSISRIDQGLGQIVSILKEAGLYEKTMILFTSDHGMAFVGAKTTAYDAGLRIPLVVRNPYEPKRGVRHEALVSHADITPTLLDFAGGLDRETNRPKKYSTAQEVWKDRLATLPLNTPEDNFGPDFRRNAGKEGELQGKYHGKSWIKILGDPKAEHWNPIFASHTFHEIQMYYPMRVVRDKKYKLIWNVAHELPYPFASDLWKSSGFQAVYRLPGNPMYGKRPLESFLHRPEFELYRIDKDTDELINLANDPDYAEILKDYKEKIRSFQEETSDPWIGKWTHQ